MPASIFLRTAGLLVLSNIFMTFAWYAHLRDMPHRPWNLAALVVFAPFAVLYMRQSLKLDYLWAAICLVGAVYFVFRSSHT